MNTFLQYSGAIGVVGATLLTVQVVLSKFVWSPVKKALIEEMKIELNSHMEKVRSDMEAELERQLQPICEAVAQLKTNGGSHLADRIIRLEERQSNISTRIDDVYDLVKSMKETK